MREGILGDFAVFSSGLDHETRLALVGLMITLWAWEDGRWPDEIACFREEVLGRLVDPRRGRSDESASAASF